MKMSCLDPHIKYRVVKPTAHEFLYMTLRQDTAVYDVHALESFYQVTK